MKENVDLNRYNYVVSLLNDEQLAQLRSYLVMSGALKSVVGAGRRAWKSGV